jgi:hypothetical protein
MGSYETHPEWRLPLKDIDEEARNTDNEWYLDQGNHKSDIKQISKVHTLVHEEVFRGFLLPFLLQSLHRLSRCCLAPVGMTYQGSIDEAGKIIENPTSLMAYHSPTPSASWSANASLIISYQLVCLASRYAGWCIALLVVGYTTRARGY